MIDSGWNCTPSTGVLVPARAATRTPMISSSQVLAVTSSASGTLSGAITNEW
jgi:protease II